MPNLLHHLGRELTYRDLRAYRHLVVRDSGIKRDRRAVSVEVDQRWTVGQIATSIQAVCMGYGFAWLPERHVREELGTGILRRCRCGKEGRARRRSTWFWPIRILPVPGSGVWQRSLGSR